MYVAVGRPYTANGLLPSMHEFHNSSNWEDRYQLYLTSSGVDGKEFTRAYKSSVMKAHSILRGINHRTIPSP